MASPSPPGAVAPAGLGPIPYHVLAALVAAPFSDLQRSMILALWSSPTPRPHSHAEMAALLGTTPSGPFRHASAALSVAGVLVRTAQGLGVEPDPTRWGQFWVPLPDRPAPLRIATQEPATAPEPPPAPSAELSVPASPPAAPAKKAKTPAAPAQPKPRAQTYIDRFVDLHLALFGSVLTHREAGRPLKVLVETHTEDVVQAAYRRYADQNQGERWCGFHNFARYFDRYAEPQAGPQTLERRILE